MDCVDFALIGYGAWGKHHAQAIAAHPRAKLTAIAVRSDASREQARRDFPDAVVFADYREMLAQSSAEVVDVVLPTDLHFDAGRSVLESGRHLLLEKPMALSVDHCDRLIELAEEKNRLLAIGHEFRLSSLWGKVKEMVDAGAIGKPLYALIELWRNPYRQGAGGWRYDIQRVGNWILEEPIHFFDLARWYFQSVGDPVSVFALANGKRPDHPELHDNFSAMLRFPGGGYALISQTLGGWQHHQIVKLTGTDGALWASWSGALDRTLEPTFWLKHQHGDLLRDIPITILTGEVYELADQVDLMVRAVRGESKLVSTGADGRWSTLMCLKAQESVDARREVTFG